MTSRYAKAGNRKPQLPLGTAEFYPALAQGLLFNRLDKFSLVCYNFNMKPNHSIIRLATLQANKVEIYRDYKTVYRFGGVLFDKHTILNTGRNYPTKSHPKSNSTYKFQHCEFNTILGVPKHLLIGSSILILRITMDDRLALAAPCTNCRFLLNQAKIRHLYYTNDKEEITYEKLY